MIVVNFLFRFLLNFALIGKYLPLMIFTLIFEIFLKMMKTLVLFYFPLGVFFSSFYLKSERIFKRVPMIILLQTEI